MFRNLIIIAILCSIMACNRLPEEHEKIVAPFLQEESLWVDSLLKNMSLEEKIGQLVLLQVKSMDSLGLSEVIHLAEDQHLGGVLLDSFSLVEYADILEDLKCVSKVPLITGTSEQVSLNNQIRSAVDFPSPATIAAIKSDSIHQELEQLYLAQCESMGINLSFSPGLIQVDEGDTLYHSAAFENNPQKRLARSFKRLEGLKDKKILSIAQAFSDWIELPNDTTNYVDSILHPYYNLVQNGVSGILLDDQIYQIDTFDQLMPQFMQSYLNEHLEFDGLLISRQTATANLDKMIHAGTDVFLVDSNVNEIVTHLKAYVEEGLMPVSEINHKVRKVLLAKSWMGLDTIPRSVNYALASKLILDKKLDFYTKELYGAGLTLVNNPDSMLPFNRIHRRSFKLIRPEGPILNSFRNAFQYYADYRDSRTTETVDREWYAVLPKNLKRSTVVIVLDQLNLNRRLHGKWIDSINDLATMTDVVVINMGNLFNLKYFNLDVAMIQANESNAINQSLAAQVLFGGAVAPGQLPIALSEELPFGHTAPLGSLKRLSYAAPQTVGIAPEKLVGIDAIFQSAIKLGATPGGQLLIAKEGKVIYEKAFGYQSTRRKHRVSATDLYDMASITKIAATTMASMKMYQEKAFRMSDRFGKHVPTKKKSKIAKISLKHLFTHASGLQPNMPIAPYIMFKDSTAQDSNLYFCKVPKGDYQIRLADSMYMDKRWVDTIWQTVFELKPGRRGRYRYSDVNFNLIQYLLEHKAKMKLDQYVDKHFFDPLHLRYTTYNPIDKFDADEICPTAREERFRNQELRGYVHDEAAALFNGVGGNAGLFSNARDLAVIFQMLLNGGEYGGEKFLDQATIDFFTSNKHGNHRGLGFDKPAKRRKIVPSYSSKASSKSYGHTGFTGPCVWVDPKAELVYIFIANRINPDVRNRKLFRNKIRGRIHNVVYEALDSYKPFDVKKIEAPVRLKEVRAHVGAQ